MPLTSAHSCALPLPPFCCCCCLPWPLYPQPQLKGRVAFPEAPREFIGIALKSLGLSMNATEADMAAAGLTRNQVKVCVLDGVHVVPGSDISKTTALNGVRRRGWHCAGRRGALSHTHPSA